MFRIMLILLASHQIDIQDVIIRKETSVDQPKCKCQCVLPDEEEEQELETGFGYNTIQFKRLMRALGKPMLIMYA
jgi:hypothetical protein